MILKKNQKKNNKNHMDTQVKEMMSNQKFKIRNQQDYPRQMMQNYGKLKLKEEWSEQQLWLC